MCVSIVTVFAAKSNFYNIVSVSFVVHITK